MIFGCSKKKTPADDDKTTVVFWHALGGPLGDALNIMIKEFNDSHSKIYIKAISMGNYTALSQKIMASIQAGTQPDIAQVFESWTAKMVDANILKSINDLIVSDSGFSQKDLDDFYPIFIKSNMINGKMYSFPFNKSVRVLYYNKDLFFQNDLNPNLPPKTWNDFIKYCKIITKRKIGQDAPTIYGTTFNVDSWQFENLLLQSGGQIMNDNYTKPLFNSKYGVESLNYLSDLLNKYKVAYLSTGYNGQNDFLAGKVAMLEGSSVSMVFMKRNGINFNLGISAIPINKTKKNIISGTNVAIFNKKNKKVENAAWEFVKWFTSSKQTAQWSSLTYYMPVRKSAFQEESLKKILEYNPEIASVYDQLNYSTFEPPIKQWYKTRKNLKEKVIEKVLRGSIEPKKALDQVATNLEKEIKEGANNEN
jgi:multiple sugar transport system substrate-binding protein